jgi:FtsZ-interacting cell division protein YlmF
MGFIAGVWRMLGAVDNELDNEAIVDYPQPQHSPTASAPAQQHGPAVINMPSPQGSSSTLCFGRPELAEGGQPSFSMKGFANQLLNRQALLLDVNSLAAQDMDEATRLVDYLSGVVEAVDGSVWEVTKNIFLFAPRNVALSVDALKQLEVY